MIKGKIILKSMSSNPDYTLLTPEGWGVVKQYSTQTDFSIGDLIEADAEEATEIKKIESPDLQRRIENFLEENSKPNILPTIVEDEAMKKFTPALEKAAKAVARRLLQLTPAFIRFNDDCDGISAGILVKKSIEKFIQEKKIPYPHNFLRNKQCNSAIYDSGEAAYDSEIVSSHQFGKKPLLFLLDFGANAESVDGLKIAKENFEVAVLDHHVYSQEAKELIDIFLNPLEFGGISSHTTGLIAHEFAKRLSQGDENYALYSMQSDKSIYWDKVERKEALVLDFLANQNYSLEKYESALVKETQFHYVEATSRLQTSFEKAMLSAKSESVAESLLINVNLEGVTIKNEFPPKGKVLNKVQEHFEKANALAASVGFDPNTIQFRVSKALHAKGFKATKIIDLIKKEFAGVNGGGHEQAAAMRFDKDYSKAVLEKTLELCRKEITACS